MRGGGAAATRTSWRASRRSATCAGRSYFRDVLVARARLLRARGGGARRHARDERVHPVHRRPVRPLARREPLGQSIPTCREPARATAVRAADRVAGPAASAGLTPRLSAGYAPWSDGSRARGLTVHLPGAAPERRELAAPVAAGGSRADGLFLPGCRAAAPRLVPCRRRPRRRGGALRGSASPAGRSTPARAGSSAGASAPSCSGWRSRSRGRPGGRRDPRRRGRPPPRRGRRRRAPIAGPHLVVLTGPAAGARHLSARSRPSDAAAPRPSASPTRRRRASTRASVSADGGAEVEDLGSKNGIRLNGIPLDRGPRSLRPGDEIAVGETVLALEDPWPAAARPAQAAGSASAETSRPRLPAHLAAAALLALSAAALALAGS